MLQSSSSTASRRNMLELTAQNLTTSSISHSLLRIVRNRLPRIASSRSDKSESETETEEPYLSRRSSGLSSSTVIGTPSPEYRSRISLTAPSLAALDDYFDSEDNESLSRPESRRSTVDGEAGSGVQWRYANQGMNLLELAAQESRAGSEDAKRTVPALTRQAYIHGVSYSIRGLPGSLTNEDINSIWSSLPAEVQAMGALTPPKGLAATTHSANDILFNDPSAPPSFVHRMIAFSILQLFLFIQLIAHYLKHIIAEIVAYERRHRVSERLLSSSLSTVDGMIKMGDKVCSMNEGRVGQALENAVVWGIKGVAGGIREGVGEGLLVLGDTTRPARRTSSEKLRRRKM